ncbi:MAG: FkbM family methyltransferase [Magnetococcales bacterium]|nr:FkbM family methyltransferase [Magnetococcales bacterium]
MNDSVNPTLFETLRPEHPTRIIDIGANPQDDTTCYRPLLTLGAARLIGFEPQTEALQQLNRNRRTEATYRPDLLADGQTHTLRVCHASVMTSLLEPDTRVCAQFQVFDQLTRVQQRLPVQTRRLDDIPEIDPIDYLKINACGSEKMVLEHGRDKLAEVAVIQLEVPFIPLYHHQPTFGELDLLLRSMGLIPHTLLTMKRWCVKPLIINQDPRIPLNQILVAEMVYVADFLHPEMLSDAQLVQLSLILHYCHQSYDVVLRCLMELANRQRIDPNPDHWYLPLCQTPD